MGLWGPKRLLLLVWHTGRFVQHDTSLGEVRAGSPALQGARHPGTRWWLRHFLELREAAEDRREKSDRATSPRRVQAVVILSGPALETGRRTPWAQCLSHRLPRGPDEKRASSQECLPAAAFLTEKVVGPETLSRPRGALGNVHHEGAGAPRAWGCLPLCGSGGDRLRGRSALALIRAEGRP